MNKLVVGNQPWWLMKGASFEMAVTNEDDVTVEIFILFLFFGFNGLESARRVNFPFRYSPLFVSVF
jgi:hypothetical protein